MFMYDDYTVPVESSFSWLWITVVVMMVICFWLLVRRLRRWWIGRKLPKDILSIARQHWQEIEKIMNDDSVIHYKMAIIEADNLLDEILKSHYFPGNTTGERLTAAGYKYPNVRKVWWAHKLRNQVVHESSFTIDKSTTKQALRVFKRVFGELGIDV